MRAAMKNAAMISCVVAASFVHRPTPCVPHGVRMSITVLTSAVTTAHTAPMVVVGTAFAVLGAMDSTAAMLAVAHVRFAHLRRRLHTPTPRQQVDPP